MSDLIKENKNNKQRLGRGLGSLLGGSSGGLGSMQTTNSTTVVMPKNIENTTMNQQQPSMPIEARVWQIPVEKLVPSKNQPRTQFVKEKLEELAASIKQNGILQPIVARKLTSGAFEIIAGERRWRAAQIAGLYEVPVIIRTLSNKETLELAIIENIQREDLSPIEEAEAYQRLIAEFNLTQAQVADKVGKERATVANALRLLHLPADVRDLVLEGKLSAGHSKVLLGLADAAQISKLAKRAIEQQFSVRKLEQEIAKIKNTDLQSSTIEMTAAPLATEKQKAALVLQDDLQKTLGTKVTIDYKAGKGKVTLYFYSDDELSEIVEKVKQGCRN